MRDARRPSAAYYRQVAAEIVELAQTTRQPELRRELLEFAERFRRMANYAETHSADRRNPGSANDGARPPLQEKSPDTKK
jgi:hypothetical protein